MRLHFFDHNTIYITSCMWVIVVIVMYIIGDIDNKLHNPCAICLLLAILFNWVFNLNRYASCSFLHMSFIFKNCLSMLFRIALQQSKTYAFGSDKMSIISLIVSKNIFHYRFKYEIRQKSIYFLWMISLHFVVI